MFTIPTADALVTFIKNFTGSSNDNEIKECIFLAEMSMRNIELPALRSDPYAPENIGVVDSTGGITIPGDMNKPILFFKQGSQVTTTANAIGNSGEYTITLTTIPSQAVQNQMAVFGAGIGAGAIISNITGDGGIGTIITLNTPNSGAVNGLITFSTTANRSSQTGPWIVYDRIGDRDIITQSMVAQLYLQPVNVPAVIRGKFSEVAGKYKFLPYVAQGDLINLYYYKAWPLLFSPDAPELISEIGNVNTIVGTGPWTAKITGMTSTIGLEVGSTISAEPGLGPGGGGSIGNGGVYTVTEVTDLTSIKISAVGGTTPIAGNIQNIQVTGLTTQTNPVLQTWPEGYVYATLREYYMKRHNDVDAAVYEGKFQQAWQTVEDQNNLGKWSGGHTRLTSVWQPRQYRQYNIK
jgi:hypothetical protein